MTFKEGQRVRCYDRESIWTGKIVEIYESDLNVAVDPPQHSGNVTTLWFSAKQCRLLKKKKAREWWVKMDSGYMISSNFQTFNTSQTAVMQTQKPDNTDGWLLVREVKQK